MHVYKSFPFSVLKCTPAHCCKHDHTQMRRMRTKVNNPGASGSDPHMTNIVLCNDKREAGQRFAFKNYSRKGGVSQSTAG